MQYLSLAEILRLHFQVIKDYGGLHGVRDEKRLKSIVEAPHQQVFGQEQYKTIYAKAAVYLRNIICDHAFLDGNKRTGITVTGVFLLRNGYRLAAEPKALEDYAIEVATSKPSIEQIAQWLEEHSQRM